VDYSIWDAFQIKQTDYLKQVPISFWDMISQVMISGDTDQRSKRLLLVVHSQGAHTQHRLC